MKDGRSANNIDHRLGQRVRARRLEIGMSQERLAELVGVTFQQVQKYEKGVNRIAASRLWEVCSALDMPIGKIFEGIGEGADRGQTRASSAPLAEDVLATPEGAQLFTLFAGVKSLAVRRRVVHLVRAIVSEESAER